MDCVDLSYWMKLVFERSQDTLYIYILYTSFLHRLQRRLLDHRAVVCHRLRPTCPVLALCGVVGRAHPRDSTNDFQQIGTQHKWIHIFRLLGNIFLFYKLFDTHAHFRGCDVWLSNIFTGSWFSSLFCHILNHSWWKRLWIFCSMVISCYGCICFTELSPYSDAFNPTGRNSEWIQRRSAV